MEVEAVIEEDESDKSIDEICKRLRENQFPEVLPSHLESLIERMEAASQLQLIQELEATLLQSYIDNAWTDFQEKIHVMKIFQKKYDVRDGVVKHSIRCHELFSSCNPSTVRNSHIA